jgi:hypothetical protein
VQLKQVINTVLDTALVAGVLVEQGELLIAPPEDSAA